jgi:hypothetical protein
MQTHLELTIAALLGLRSAARGGRREARVCQVSSRQLLRFIGVDGKIGNARKEDGRMADGEERAGEDE